MAQPTNNVYEMQILVRPGSGGGMPPDAVGGEALCYVGAPGHVEAFGLAVEALNARGVVVEGIVGNSVGLVEPSKWNEHARDISRQVAARFGGSASSVRKNLPAMAEIRRIARDGGFLLGPFYCWDTEPHAGPDTGPSACGGPDLTDEQIQRHDECFTTGCELIEGLLYLEKPSYQPPDASAKKRLRKAIKAFEQALAIIPTNWRAMLLMGKAFQSLGDWEQSLTAFVRAHDCAPAELSAALEAGSSAGRLGRHDLAIRVMEAVARHHPDDPRLAFNLALSYLFQRDFAMARAAIDRAIELEPARDENRRLLTLVVDVESGKQPCPENEADVARALS
jgi:tetratricopeptide (TPR) repeat protein